MIALLSVFLYVHIFVLSRFSAFPFGAGAGEGGGAGIFDCGTMEFLLLVLI